MAAKKLLLPTHAAHLVARASPGSFDFPPPGQPNAGNPTLVGNTASCTVYYDPSLGQPGLDAATALMGVVQTMYDITASAFSSPSGGPVNVIIAALSGTPDEGQSGAYHYGCDFATGADLYLDMTTDPLMLAGLFVAELSECFMGAQGKGWDCGGSNGEALSRYLAEQVSGGANGSLAAFASAPAWDNAGRPDWISRSETTDQDPVSTGCGMVYLSWLRSLALTDPAIVAAAGSTLADNYQALTGKTTAYADMIAALAGRTITNDDPFAGPAPVPQPSPPPPPSPPPSPSPPPPPPPPPVPGGITQAEANAAIDAYAAVQKAIVAATLPA